jgi:hypothetical protein
VAGYADQLHPLTRRVRLHVWLSTGGSACGSTRPTYGFQPAGPPAAAPALQRAQVQRT